MSNLKYFSLSDKDNLSNTYSVSAVAEVKQQLLSKIEKWDYGVRLYLGSENPFFKEQQNLKIAQRSLKQENASIEEINKDFLSFKSLASKTRNNAQKEYWLKEINELKKRSNSKKPKTTGQKKAETSKSLTLRTLMQKQWEKLLDKEYMAWELKALDEYRKKFLEEIEKWLALLQELFDTINELSLSPGLLFDLSKGNVSLSDIKTLKKWLDYIAENKEVKKLCEMMGRLKKSAINQRKELVKQTKIMQEFIPDIDSNEEITGIRLGNEIEHILPQELALFGDDDTSILFDMKFIEARLLCFDMQGMQEKETLIEKEVMAEVAFKEALGPIILCVDTSGSMQGAPETIAKALALFMSTRANEQNRKCFIINFSTGIETLDLSENMGMSELIQFLQRSFNGGTDAAPALEHAVNLMKDEAYKKSDLLMISDFIMEGLPSALIKKITEAKTHKNKFYSLAIGSLFLEQRMKDVFNEEWVYNPNNNDIQKLYSIADTIAK
ncbi:MAG: VWA domain-containing protein [Gammaproteobacteria bacterium]|nr:VWA domain-containing protein [Gammaproteobacteria bacterium]